MRKLQSATPVWLPALLEQLLIPLSKHNPEIAFTALQSALTAAQAKLDDNINNIEGIAFREAAKLLPHLCEQANRDHIDLPPASRSRLRSR
jgi:hypothetical protein